MARKPTQNGYRKSIISADMGDPKKKVVLTNIAKNKGMCLTDFVRSILFKVIDEAPDRLKINRHSDDGPED